ncbi:MAG: hypothetical protein JNK87_40835 [Bryobacterales bacterium]|nr:hypothetical protein [Bryobacterales bacterium]
MRIVSSCMVLGLALLGAENPDLSGEWILDAARSKGSGLPLPSQMTVSIDHREPELHITQKTASGLPRAYRYRTDGTPTRNTSPHGVELESVAAWEGADLTIKTAMAGSPGASRVQAMMEDRWSVAKDSRSLQLKRGPQVFVFRKK